MEIKLSNLQVEKILRIVEGNNSIESKITALEQQITALKTSLDEHKKHQNDIVETILECNGVDLTTVIGLNLTDNVLKVTLKAIETETILTPTVETVN
jgi:hypothetical protein